MAIYKEYVRNGRVVRQRVDLDNRRDWILEQYETRTAKSIASQIGVSYTTLKNYIYRWRREGLFDGKNIKSQQLEDFKDSIIELHQVDGWVAYKLADKFDVSGPTMIAKLKEWGVYHTHQNRVRELKDDILAAKEEGLNLTQIARRFQTDRSNISNWIKRWEKEACSND